MMLNIMAIFTVKYFLQICILYFLQIQKELSPKYKEQDTEILFLLMGEVEIQ